MTDEELKRLALTLDAWKHIVSVQMHFNEMEMKIRNLYFLVVAAAFALLGAVQGKGILISFLNLRVSLSLFVFLGLIPISALFYFIDRHWYHRLLLGAVEQSSAVEKKFADVLPEIQLGNQILKKSPIELRSRIWRWIFFFVRDARFRKDGRLHSDQKIEVLYKSVMIVCALCVLIYGFIGGVQVKECAVLPWMFGLPCGVEQLSKQVNATANDLRAGIKPVGSQNRLPSNEAREDQRPPTVEAILPGGSTANPGQETLPVKCNNP